PPENPSVFGRIGARKSLCIMHLGLYPSLSLPTDSAEEPNLEHFIDRIKNNYLSSALNLT
ncbi:hypothetical protein, partial [Thiolapillus sp.]|uniref:hypothetical protein n=1 Tax=Thiolapillus sp. TaxID=2017437 RepID=UPI003AF7E1E4